MEPVIAALVGLAVGAAIVWLAKRSEVARISAAQDAERQRADSASRDLEAERVALAASRARLEEVQRAHKEKIDSLERVRGDIEKELKGLAQQALKDNQSSFLGLANEVFDKHRERVDGELKPIKTALADWRKNLEEIEKTRREHYGSLTTELKNVVDGQEKVRGEAARLVNALRAAPKTRGRWGEETLRNVLELSGMTEHCDFQTEQSLRQDTELLRPDVIIRLPGERYMIVDAKTSLAAYMDAMEAEDDEAREDHLKRHAGQLRTHMRGLASKRYQDALDVTPDFVVMFVPGDNFYAAAIERDPTLYDEALKSNVLIVTPTVMLGLAKAVAFGWRQEKVAENAREVARLGQELYQRMGTMGDHIAGLGQDIARSVRRYNAFVGSLESRVMPQARRFADLKVEGASQPLPETPYVDTEVQMPRADRDLVIGPTAETAPDPHPPVEPAAE